MTDEEYFMPSMQLNFSNEWASKQAKEVLTSLLHESAVHRHCCVSMSHLARSENVRYI
jgi:hypothetical protein